MVVRYLEGGSSSRGDAEPVEDRGVFGVNLPRCRRVGLVSATTMMVPSRFPMANIIRSGAQEPLKLAGNSLGNAESPPVDAELQLFPEPPAGSRVQRAGLESANLQRRDESQARIHPM